MHARSSIRHLQSALVFAASSALALAALHCGSEESVPLYGQFGRGGSSSGDSGGSVVSDAGGGGTSGGASSGSPDDGFDPLADGGYWSDYDAGEDGVTEDGGLNGGPGVYARYPSCPVVKIDAFQLDVKTGEAAAYGASYTPSIEGTTDRISLIVASAQPLSYLGPFFPLGFRDPPRVLDPSNGLLIVGTYPFPGCKRCLSVSTGESDTALIAIGGMLSIAPVGNPMSGSIAARVDLAVLVEASKAGGGNFRPIPGGRCMRVLTAPIVVR